MDMDMGMGGKEPFVLERLGGEHKGVVVGHLDEPKRRNALSKRCVHLLRSTVAELKFDRSARVLILRSRTDGVFCAGADLKERKEMGVEEVHKFVDSLRALMSELSALPMPVIAAIDGHALGGGMELALACDMRIASPKARMGLPETKLAIIPGAGGTQRLPRLIGLAKAKELIMTGRLLNGDEANQIGLVNHVVADPDEKCLELAREILKTGPVAVRLAKLAMDTGFELELHGGLAVEQQCYAQVIPTSDRLEGLKAFAEKRPPVYKGE